MSLSHVVYGCLHHNDYSLDPSADLCFASSHVSCHAALLSARLPVLPGFQVSIALLLLWWCHHPNPPQSYRIRLKGTGSDVHVSSGLQGPISVFLPSSASCMPPCKAPQSRFGDGALHRTLNPVLVTFGAGCLFMSNLSKPLSTLQRSIPRGL